MTSRSYQQNCALAYGLDLIGERWTLLIVRELLLGPRRYKALQQNLAGIGTNLLAARLREMADNGLIKKSANGYALTEFGKLLEPVVHSIVRFGLALQKDDQPDWLTVREWDAVALRAVYDPKRGEQLSGRYVLELNGAPFLIDRSDQAGVNIIAANTDAPVARVSLSKSVARLLAAGKQTLQAAMDSGEVVVAGSREQAALLLAAFGILRLPQT